MSADKSQNGNALWFILVAIVLLGALTVLLTRSGTAVNQSGDVEQNRIKAGQMMRWAKGLESAIEQMKLRGISESLISFDNDDTLADYNNPGCTTNDCKVFANGGGGQNYMKPPTGAAGSTEWVFNGQHNIGSTENPVGTTAQKTGNDLIVYLPAVNDAICIQINKDLGVGTPGTLPVEGVELLNDPYVGVFEDALKVIDGDDTAHELNGKAAGCYVDATSGQTIFYYVLIAR